MKSTKKYFAVVIAVVVMLMALVSGKVFATEPTGNEISEGISETLIPITGVNVTLTAPKVGDKVEKVEKDSDGYKYYVQSAYPAVTATTEGLLVNGFWLGLTPEEPMDPEDTFYGTFEEGKEYYALVDFEAEEGYELSDTFASNIKVNGAVPFKVGEVMMGTWGNCIVKITPTTASASEEKEEETKTDDTKTEEEKKAEETKTDDTKTEEKTSEKVATVIPEEDASEEDVSAAKEVSSLVDDILAGKEVEGIDAETATKVVAAKAAGKEVKVDFSSKEVKKEEVAEDVEKAEQKLAANEKIAGIFDVSINLKAGNDQLGKVTKLNKKVAFKLPIPEELRTVPAGYERIFSMLRIHDGLTSRMDVDSDGENVSGESEEYSTYVLTYTDKKITSNPETGDMIALSVAIFAITTAGAVVVFRKLK